MALRPTTSVSGATHQSEKIFRRYERYIAQWVKNYPEPLVAVSEVFSTATFASHLRSAIAGVLIYNYQTDIDLSALAEYWKMSKVIVRDNKIFLLPREYNPVALDMLSPTGGQAVFVTINDPTAEQLSALAVLYATGVATLPSRLTGAMPPWSPPPGAVLARQPDDSFLLL